MDGNLGQISSKVKQEQILCLWKNRFVDIIQPSILEVWNGEYLLKDSSLIKSNCTREISSVHMTPAETRRREGRVYK